MESYIPNYTAHRLGPVLMSHTGRPAPKHLRDVAEMRANCTDSDSVVMVDSLVVEVTCVAQKSLDEEVVKMHETPVR